MRNFMSECEVYDYRVSQIKSKLAPKVRNMQVFVLRWFWNPETDTFLTTQPVFMKKWLLSFWTRCKSDLLYFFLNYCPNFAYFFLLILILHDVMLGITACLIKNDQYLIWFCFYCTCFCYKVNCLNCRSLFS